MKRLVLLAFAALMATAVLGGCNTMEGFGKDLKKVGDKIEESANK